MQEWAPVLWGPNILRKRIAEDNVEGVLVTNCAINDLHENAYIVITHSNLTQRARTKAPDSEHLSIYNFLDGKFYQDLVTRISHEAERI